MNRMMKGLSALFVTALASSPALSWEIEAMNRQIDQTNFSIEGTCSGTLISVEERLVLTADHCLSEYELSRTKRNGVYIESEKHIPVGQQLFDGHVHVGSEMYMAEIAARSPENDIALLKLLRDVPEGYKAAPIAPVDYKIIRGQKVFVVGNPKGLFASVSTGIVSSVTRILPKTKKQKHRDGVPAIQSDATINGGSSGGALYNDEGEMIGVNVIRYKEADMTHSVPFYVVYDFLHDAGYGEEFGLEMKVSG